MAKERKSPQQKKELEYTRNHFTFGWVSSRNFPQTWKRKKARVNRSYRRKSEEILAEVKPGVASNEVEWVAEDLTAARFQKSISRKRLRKSGVVTVGEKIKRKLERRKEAAGRHGRRDQKHDNAARSAVETLSSLQGERLIEFVRRADLVCNARNPAALKSVLPCKDQFGQALYFLDRIAAGGFERDALQRNPELNKAFGRWLEKANRILTKIQRTGEVKVQQKKVLRTKLKAKGQPNNP